MAPSHATVRVLQRWGKPFAFALNQAPARYDVQEADPLHRLGVLAAPCIVLRNDHQHAIGQTPGVSGSHADDHRDDRRDDAHQ